MTLRIVARWADEWNTWGLPHVLAAKGAVLERHCEAIGRDPSTISRSAQVLFELEDAWDPEAPRRRGFPTASGSVAELQELLGAFSDARVHELVVPDWNLGAGAARRDAMDRFIEEVAAPFREG